MVSNDPTPMTGLNLETVKFYGWPADPTLITVNGNGLDVSQWNYDASVSVLTITMSAPLDQDMTMVLS